MDIDDCELCESGELSRPGHVLDDRAESVTWYVGHDDPCDGEWTVYAIDDDSDVGTDRAIPVVGGCGRFGGHDLVFAAHEFAARRAE